MEIGIASVDVRLFTPDDDISPLTSLLHRAYAQLGEMGWLFKAVDQTDDVTRQRADAGECYVAVAGGRLVGTVLYVPATDKRDTMARSARWREYSSAGSGPRSTTVGSWDRTDEIYAEAPAAICGASEFALDTAEPATHLQEWYISRGYRPIECAQWAHTNYRRIIMSKPLGETA